MIRAAVLICMLLPAGSASAITLDAAIGFNGYFVPGRWTPVHITLENLPRADKARQNVREFDGVCEVHAAGLPGVPEQVFSRAIQVPVGDRKRITIYATLSSSKDIEIVLLSKSQERILSERFPVKPLTQNERLAAYINITGANFVFPRVPDLTDIITAGIQPDQLPDKWYGYDSLSLLIIPRITDQLFDTEKARALEQWVMQGGDVLFLGGRYGQSYRGSRIESLLPGTYQSNDAYRLNGDQLEPVAAVNDTGSDNIVLTQLQQVAGAKPLYSLGEIPLLTSRNSGAGRTLFLSTDWPPRLPPAFPLAQLIGMHVRTKPTLEGVRRRFNDEFMFRNPAMFDLGTAALLPKHSFILLILLSYLICVGPLNFYLLHRKKRLELAWITVPLIVVAYTAGIYALSTSIKGSGSHLRTFHLLTGRAGASAYRCDSISMLFLPSPGTHRIEFPGAETAAAHHTVWGSSAISGAGAFSQRPVIISQTSRGMNLPHKFIRQWDTDFTRFDSVAQNGAIDVILNLEPTAIAGEIINRSQGPVSELVLYIMGKPFQVRRTNDASAIAPGETIGFRYLIKDVVESPGEWHAQATSQSQALVATIFMEAMKPMPDNDLPPCVLFGRMHTELPAVKTSAQISTQQQYVLFAVDVPVNTQGVDAMPQIAIPLKSSGGMAWQRRVPGQLTEVGSEGSVFALQANSPLPDFSLLDASIAYSRRENLGALQCEYFDFSGAAWSPLPLRQLSIRKVPPEIHDGSAGIAQIRFENARNAVHPFDHSMLLKLKRTGGMFSGNVAVSAPMLQPAVGTEKEQ